MSDLISRQAALEALTIEYNAVGILGEQWAVSQCIDAVNKLPTIDPVKHGEWIAVEYNDGTVRTECSVCGYGRGLPPVRNYCPNCGAKMEIE